MIDYDLIWIRREIIAAIASDEALRGVLILKGGNALCIVHEIGMRASVDIDYSMQADADNWRAMGSRIFSALKSHFAGHDLVLFDEKFEPRPRTSSGPDSRWGGYNAEFKLTAKSTFDEHGDDIGRLRRQAITTSEGMQSGRKFRIEISKYEFCTENEEKAVANGLVCRVYTPELIAAEKLRSLCQQMEDYKRRSHQTPRARDFYDIYALCTEGFVEFSDQGFQESLQGVFAAKEVPLGLLAQLKEYRDYHQPDWSEVLNAIPAGKPREYDFYFDFVLQEIRKLEPLWTINPPTSI